MRDVHCLPECDERHAEDCPAEAAEMAYWARYFGQDRGTREERRACLERMRPLGVPSEEERRHG